MRNLKGPSSKRLSHLLALQYSARRIIIRRPKSLTLTRIEFPALTDSSIRFLTTELDGKPTEVTESAWDLVGPQVREMTVVYESHHSPDTPNVDETSEDDDGDEAENVGTPEHEEVDDEMADEDNVEGSVEDNFEGDVQENSEENIEENFDVNAEASYEVDPQYPDDNPSVPSSGEEDSVDPIPPSMAKKVRQSVIVMDADAHLGCPTPALLHEKGCDMIRVWRKVSFIWRLPAIAPSKPCKRWLWISYITKATFGWNIVTGVAGI